MEEKPKVDKTGGREFTIVLAFFVGLLTFEAVYRGNNNALVLLENEGLWYMTLGAIAITFGGKTMAPLIAAWLKR